ncbi:hypothetical protein LZ31DRAFT_44075 [Colletotrichum somersetense]|nr:hypothetical protein LZ31DRAFT_44075 [Colletotrichum somersetense]
MVCRHPTRPWNRDDGADRASRILTFLCPFTILLFGGSGPYAVLSPACPQSTRCQPIPGPLQGPGDTRCRPFSRDSRMPGSNYFGNRGCRCRLRGPLELSFRVLA